MRLADQGLIGRDQADVATLFKQLEAAIVSIVILAEGEISELHAGLKGTMTALFLKDLTMKIHRGLRGSEEGQDGGGLSEIPLMTAVAANSRNQSTWREPRRTNRLAGFALAFHKFIM